MKFKYFVDTENISLEYSEDREVNGELPYRITLYDKYGHFDKEFFISGEQLKDLAEGLKNNELI